MVPVKGGFIPKYQETFGSKTQWHQQVRASRVHQQCTYRHSIPGVSALFNIKIQAWFCILSTFFPVTPSLALSSNFGGDIQITIYTFIFPFARNPTFNCERPKSQAENWLYANQQHQSAPSNWYIQRDLPKYGISILTSCNFSLFVKCHPLPLTFLYESGNSSREHISNLKCWPEYSGELRF